ncbi:MAG TPA: hypothetical protein DEB40_04650 [Elusimicrobia bacterium]|nr:hypothetical protein [Elusimicrobiota bacterium]HBT61013.1 hypothetical protein [Elusimicrobiota bacterium]
MILEPINSITSIAFYRKVAGQKVWRSFLYLAYVGLIFSAVFTFMLKIRVWPAIMDTFQWLETSVPTLTFANGRLSTPTNELLTVRHPTIEKIAVAFDTARTEPVTPQLMADNKVLAYVTGNAMYIMQPGGKVEVYDFSKAPNPKPVVVDADFYREIARGLAAILYPIGFLAAFALFMVWKTVSTLFYSLVALMINGVADARLEYKALFNICAFAQTLVIAVQGILLIIPARVPFFGPLALAATTIYIWLAVKTNAPQQQAS